MILYMFSLLDTKSGAYNTPFFFPHPAMAVRAVSDLASDLNTTVGRHPADFVLYQLGAWDDQAGEYTPQRPESLGTAVSFLQPNKPLPFDPATGLVKEPS